MLVGRNSLCQICECWAHDMHIEMPKISVRSAYMHNVNWTGRIDSPCSLYENGREDIGCLSGLERIMQGPQ